MTQLTLTQARQAVATTLTNQIPGLRVVLTRLGQVNPPCVMVLPHTGTFATYQVSMDGQADWTLRVVVVASLANSQGGQDILDPYLSVTGPLSIWAAVRADTTLGGQVGYANVTEANGYGDMFINDQAYLAATLIVEIGD
jgi:hypothetical protein